MSDWCPENDGAYRAEMAAMYPVANRKRIAELIEEGSVMAQKLDAAEAKLAKAVQFTEGVIRYAGNSGDDYLAEQARTTLAAVSETHKLKGETDE